MSIRKLSIPPIVVWLSLVGATVFTWHKFTIVLQTPQANFYHEFKSYDAQGFVQARFAIQCLQPLGDRPGSVAWWISQNEILSFVHPSNPYARFVRYAPPVRFIFDDRWWDYAPKFKRDGFTDLHSIIATDSKSEELQDWQSLTRSITEADRLGIVLFRHDDSLTRITFDLRPDKAVMPALIDACRL